MTHLVVGAVVGGIINLFGGADLATCLVLVFPTYCLSCFIEGFMRWS